jgi:uncharacterized protein YjbJ (UPF0337 family)
LPFSAGPAKAGVSDIASEGSTTMGETTDKLKGKAEQALGGAKESIGRASGDERLEAEGRVERAEGAGREDAARARGRLKGAANELGGAIKSAAGDLTGDRSLQAEGEAQRLKGDVERKVNR